MSCFGHRALLVMNTDACLERMKDASARLPYSWDRVTLPPSAPGFLSALGRKGSSGSSARESAARPAAQRSVPSPSSTGPDLVAYPLLSPAGRLT